MDSADSASSKASNSPNWPDSDFPEVSGELDDKGFGVLSEQAFDAAYHDLLQHGCVKVKRFLSPDKITSMRSSFEEKYKRFYDHDQSDGLKVGDRRHMITVALEEAFNNVNIYANTSVFSLLATLLTNDLVIDCMGAFLARPHAEEQHIHRDNPPIFSEDVVSDYYDLPHRLPPYCITLFIPLVELNSRVGGTRVWQNSHRASDTGEFFYEESTDFNKELPCFAPKTDLGDAYLIDMRMLHHGMKNNSDFFRPIYFISYTRPWYSDWVNFSGQPPLIVSQASLSKVPELYKNLFVRART